MTCGGFKPPTDENGRTLNVYEWRERTGDPIGAEEQRLMSERNALDTAMYERVRAVDPNAHPTIADYMPGWRIERLLRALQEPQSRMHWRHKREAQGVPVTSDEETLRDEIFYIEMTHAHPWTHDELVRSNELHRKLWDIAKAKGVSR